MKASLIILFTLYTGIVFGQEVETLLEVNESKHIKVYLLEETSDTPKKNESNEIFRRSTSLLIDAFKLDSYVLQKEVYKSSKKKPTFI